MSMLAQIYDPAFVRAELARLEDERIVLGILSPAYLDGAERTLGWLVGTHTSPLYGYGGEVTGPSFETEYRTARLMVDDPERGYDGLDPRFVLAVYRVLRWVQAGSADARALLADPLRDL